MKKMIFTSRAYFLLIIFFLSSVLKGKASEVKDSSIANQRWNIHFQSTVVSQMHPGFSSSYSGNNSLSSHEEWQNSLTSTLFLGARLWNGAQAYFNPELTGGGGLSHTQGIAGFPNGEIYRVDSPTPKVSLARLYVQQTFGFGQGLEKIEEGPNQLSGTLDSSRFTISLGRFSLNDFFDDNKYSHDPRTQFLNWSLMDYGAWDYAADTKGYTWGANFEFKRWNWTLRLAMVLVPQEANGIDMDLNILHAHGYNLELEHSFFIGSLPGTVRWLAYQNTAHMGDYRTTLRTPSDSLNIARSRNYSVKYGFGMNVEQSLTSNIGVFARLSWNDGSTETWAFTEIDRSVTLGVDLNGYQWKRNVDHMGIAFIHNQLSHAHADYLAAGGYGFIIGDGELNYNPEEIFEFYYLYQLFHSLGISFDFQEVLSPAYNADRGPVPIFAGRLHLEF